MTGKIFFEITNKAFKLYYFPVSQVTNFERNIDNKPPRRSNGSSILIERYILLLNLRSTFLYIFLFAPSPPPSECSVV